MLHSCPNYQARGFNLGKYAEIMGSESHFCWLKPPSPLIQRAGTVALACLAQSFCGRKKLQSHSRDSLFKSSHRGFIQIARHNNIEIEEGQKKKRSKCGSAAAKFLWLQGKTNPAKCGPSWATPTELSEVCPMLH